MRDFVINASKDEQMSLLKNAASAFYENGSQSLLEDEEYDYLESKLGIRGLSLLGFKEVKVFTMDSKTQVKGDFDKVISELTNTCNLPKWDGCSLVAYYNYIESTGKSYLVKVISKSSGFDKTKEFGKFFPKSLQGNWSYLQGEALVELKHGFDERSRQKANGLVNSKTMQSEINKYITVAIFAGHNKVNGIIPGCLCRDYIDTDETVNQNHIYSPIYENCKVVKNKLTTPDGRQFLIDGVVAYGSSKIRGYKFYFTDSAVTTVTNIKWQKSKFGNYTPVAIFDQVKIEGCKITKASVGSVDKMVKRGIGIGAKVTIIRANSTIPKIHEVIERSTNFGKAICPICGHPFDLHKSVGGKVRCWNHECNDERDRMVKLLRKSDLKSIDSKFIKNLINLERQKLSSILINEIIDFLNGEEIIKFTTKGLSSASEKLFTFKIKQLSRALILINNK